MKAILLIGMFTVSTCSAGERVIHGICSSVLADRLGLTLKSDIGTQKGISDIMTLNLEQPNGAGIEEISFGVYLTVDEAKGVQAGRFLLRTTYEVPDPSVPMIGDASRYWRLGAGNSQSSILFRRENCVVDIYASKPLAETVALAQLIDSWIQTDEAVAPRGEFTSPPAITLLTLPASAAAEGADFKGGPGVMNRMADPQYVQMHATFAGLGDVADLRIFVVGRDDGPQVHSLATNGKSVDRITYVENGQQKSRPLASYEDGRFILRMPKQQSGLSKRRMIAVTPDNLIVTKDFEITVTPAATSQPASHPGGN